MNQDPEHTENNSDIDLESIQHERRRARVIRQRNIVLAVAGVALVAAAVLILIIWRSRQSASEAESEVTPVVSVKVVKAERGSIAAPISAVGTIWPREKADVAAKVSAPIRQMALLKSKLVKEGEVIAVLESRDLQAQRAEAVGALNEARANERSVLSGTIPKTNAEDQKALMDARAKVNNARALYERRRVLFENGGISKKDLEQSQLDLTTAEDELKLQEQTVALRTRSLNPNDRALAAARTAQAQQRVATLDAQLSYATIRAPRSEEHTSELQSRRDL